MPRLTTITLAALMTATLAGTTPTLAQTGQPPASRQQLSAQARASMVAASSWIVKRDIDRRLYFLVSRRFLNANRYPLR